MRVGDRPPEEAAVPRDLKLQGTIGRDAALLVNSHELVADRFSHTGEVAAPAEQPELAGRFPVPRQLCASVSEHIAPMLPGRIIIGCH